MTTMNMTMTLVGLMAWWTTLSIVAGLAAGGALRYSGRRDGLVPIASGVIVQRAA